MKTPTRLASVGVFVPLLTPAEAGVQSFGFNRSGQTSPVDGQRSYWIPASAEMSGEVSVGP